MAARGVCHGQPNRARANPDITSRLAMAEATTHQHADRIAAPPLDFAGTTTQPRRLSRGHLRIVTVIVIVVASLPLVIRTST